MMIDLCDRVIPDCGLGAQELRQRQAAEGQPADAQELAAGHAVAQSSEPGRESTA